MTSLSELQEKQISHNGQVSSSITPKIIKHIPQNLGVISILKLFIFLIHFLVVLSIILYSIISNNKTLDKVAFNYNTSESIISSMNTDELKEFISKNNIKNIKIISTNNTQLNKIITEQENGKEYWKIAILLSLLFFAFEILLIKLIKI